MDRDGKFVSEWKPIHEAGMGKFLLRTVLSNLLVAVILIAVSFFIFHDRVGFIITVGVATLFGSTLGSIMSWFMKNGRYKKLKG